MQLGTPLSRTKGLGSAKEGLGHWTAQRLTAIANVVLIVWFLISAMTLAGAGYQETKAWLTSPVSAGLMLLLIASAFYHVKLGLQVVIEDYLHNGGLKIAAITAVTLVTTALGVISAVAVLQVSLAG